MMSAYPVIEHDPIRLRGLREADWPGVVEAASDPYIVAVTTVPARCDEPGARDFIRLQHRRLAEGTGYSFAVARRADDLLVGQVGVWLRDRGQGRATLGYWVRPSARGNGFAAAALGAATGFVRSLEGIVRLELYIEPGNRGSIRTAERCGYRREGLLRSHQEIAGRRRDMALYALIIGSPAAGPGS